VHSARRAADCSAGNARRTRLLDLDRCRSISLSTRFLSL
jgi:hypothetical protein